MKIALALVSVMLLSVTPISFGNATASTTNAGAALAASPKDIVDFNTQTLKYHDPNCIWAKRCTVHCIEITRAEAKKRGGIPCKVCGGGEF